MPQREIDSLSSNGAQLVASLLTRIDGLMAQIAQGREASGRGEGAAAPDYYAALDSLAVDSAGNVCVGDIPHGGITVVSPEDAGQFLATAFARAEGERRTAGGQAAAQGPARRRAQAGRESRRHATLLR